jgi:transcriptional regulator with XRE-family HTH domain
VALPPEEIVFYQRFGRLLARARARAKEQFSQQGLAVALGLSRTSVTNIERGRQPVQLHTLYKIARVLGVELTSLLPSAPNSAMPAQSETSLRQNEWLRRITPHGDLKNAKVAGKNSRAGSQNTPRQ